MKTNVAIELNDDQRNKLANVIDRKVTKRLATRKEISDFCRGSIDSALVERDAPIVSGCAVRQVVRTSVRTTPYPEDEKRLAGKSTSYVIGYNKVKESGKRL